MGRDQKKAEKNQKAALAVAPVQTRDVNSKEIFKNPMLCSQFLRDNVDIPELKNVLPEDIEDVSERYQPYFGVEFESDTVKKIFLRDEKGDKKGTELFLISLIEHKSRVDYDITMQLLRYMICIWHEYAKEMERKRKGITKRKGFRYPPILPIVYYEGSARWTASRCLRDRIFTEAAFEKYVPDFTYEVVRVHDYSNKELLARGDEMSLIMMINKVQNREEFRQFRQSPPGQLDEVLAQADPQLLEIIRNVMYSLMMKMNVPVETANNYVEMIGGSRMGYLFENFKYTESEEVLEAQNEAAKAKSKAAEARNEAAEAKSKAAEARNEAAEARNKAAEAQNQAMEARERAEKAESRLQEANQKIEESGYKNYIAACKELACTKEETAERFAGKFRENLPKDCREAGLWAREKVEQYWNET